MTGKPAPGGTASKPAAPGRFGGGMWAGDGTLSAQQRDLLDYVQVHRNGARFALTVTNTFGATPYILRAGADVLSLGGFSGQVPYPTLSQFEQYVASGQVRYVYLAAFGPGGYGGQGQARPPGQNRAQGQGGQQTAASQIEAWVPAHCSTVPASDYGGGSAPGNSGTLYLCSGS